MLKILIGKFKMPEGRLKGKICMILCMILIFIPLHAQNISVKGVVTDGNTNVT